MSTSDGLPCWACAHYQWEPCECPCRFCHRGDKLLKRAQEALDGLKKTE